MHMFFFGFFFGIILNRCLVHIVSISMLIRILTPYEVGLVLLVRQ